jgi:hypothetical protein
LGKSITIRFNLALARTYAAGRGEMAQVLMIVAADDYLRD